MGENEKKLAVSQMKQALAAFSAEGKKEILLRAAEELGLKINKPELTEG